jgi:hypothetical protein
VRHARWKWIDGSREWESFEAWRAGLPAADQAELEAGLRMLLRYGPEGCSKVGDDLYVVYACRLRKVYWIIAGIAQPCERRLLVLAWGTRPTASSIASAAAEAAEQLRRWRNAPWEEV